jgi:hypothetical protein
MRKIFSLVCAVFMTVMMFGQSYGILVNGSKYFAGTHQGKNFEDYDEYLAHVQINAGDYCQLYDADNKAAWAVALNTWSKQGFTLNGDRYEASVSGCYDFYIQLKYQADQLYIGDGSDCGEGEEISGGEGGEESEEAFVGFDASTAPLGEQIAAGLAKNLVNVEFKETSTGKYSINLVEGGVEGSFSFGGVVFAYKNSNAGTTAWKTYGTYIQPNGKDREVRIPLKAGEKANIILVEACTGVLVNGESVDFEAGDNILTASAAGLVLKSASTKPKIQAILPVEGGDEPIVDTKYYMKNNWDAGSDWFWKEMSKDGDVYKLANVVFGGTGVNFNTAESDEGATWKALEEISGDAIEAKDTVTFVLNPAAGEVSATLVGKYQEGGDEPGEGLKNPVLTVNVPAGTEEVYVAGDFSEWAFLPMAAVKDVENQFTLTIEGEFEAIAYKYACGNDWAYREVAEDGTDIENRSYAELDVVAKWLAVPGGDEPPTPGKEGYALLVNGTDLIDLTHGEEYEGYDQWFVEGAALKAGDVVKVHSYETEASWAIGILNPASSKHVVNSEEGLVFDQDGEYTIYLKLKFEADEIYVAPLADEGGDEPVADGFYLIGTFNDWTPSAQYAFVLNPDAAPAVEYKVSVDLQEGDKLKGLAVIMGQWIYYPEGDDIVVPAEYAGNCTIYFRPEYNPDWAAFGGHIYIVKQSGQGIDEILSEGKAVKVLREGQVLIMKGNRTYTPMGQIVK